MIVSEVHLLAGKLRKNLEKTTRLRVKEATAHASTKRMAAMSMMSN
jgi:hypothetical protein